METKKIEIRKQNVPNIKQIIVVASGKGGVGKSTVAASLAFSLANKGYATGLLDADLYGPSLPVLFNLHDKKPFVKLIDDKNFLVPFVKQKVKGMSIGFLVDSKQALIWRGPLVSNAIKQLLNDTLWGELDYLIVDTPPGTGDIHITLLQNYVISGVVVVTTPQKMALSDVRKAIQMYTDKKIGVPILGLVENMAWFTPKKHPDEKYFVFGQSGGELLAQELSIPLLAQIPVNEQICALCDRGKVGDLLLEEDFSKHIHSFTDKFIEQINLTI